MLSLMILAVTRPTKMVRPLVVARPNLAVNGNFSAGNAGFHSDYTFNQSVFDTGSYFVGKDPHDSHAGGASFRAHSGVNGLMLIANGSTNADNAVWKQTIKVSQNHSYWFGMWAASWGNFNSGDNDPSPAKLVVSINGAAVGGIFPVQRKNGAWTKFAAQWSSGNATSAEIRIVDQNLEGLGNDFAVDDIVFHK